MGECISGLNFWEQYVLDITRASYAETLQNGSHEEIMTASAIVVAVAHHLKDHVPASAVSQVLEGTPLQGVTPSEKEYRRSVRIAGGHLYKTRKFRNLPLFDAVIEKQLRFDSSHLLANPFIREEAS